MRTWVAFPFQLLIKHITRWASQNLAFLPPRRSPSSNSFSSQNYHKGRFRNFKGQRDLILSNSRPLLSFFGHCFSTAIQLFEEMPQRIFHVNNVDFGLVLDYIRLSLKRPRTVTAYVAHCASLKIGALGHLPISTSLLTVYSKAGDFKSSRDLFGEINNRDIIAWNAIVAACLENNCYSRALGFLDEMSKAQIGFDSTTLLLMVSVSLHMKNFEHGQAIHCLSVKSGMLVDISLGNALTDMHAKCGDLSSAESLFEEMEYKDVVSWNSIMRGSLYNSDPEKSLYYFKRMTCAGETADCIGLSCAISASSRLGKLAFGQSIHGQGIKLGYRDRSHVSFSNSLISLYSQSGDISDAETVFREIAQKDVVSWNAMMEGFASNEKVNEVFDLLLEMQRTGSFQPDVVTFTTILPLCAELLLSKEGRTIHAFAIRRQMVPDHLPMLNSLIDMYSKFNLVEKARILFNSASQRDLVSWNVMISGYSQNSYSEEARDLFRELLNRVPNCSPSTVFAILSSCDSLDSLHFGRSIHCWKLKSGFLNNILLVNSLMHMYINCGDLKAGFSILQENSAVADIGSWNTLIVGCVRGDHFQEALETFSLMRQLAAFNHDSITIVGVLSACANLGLLSQGKTLHGLTHKSPLQSDTRVQNSLITMYGRCEDIDSARVVFKFCSVPNLCSWNCMISALSHNKESREALEFFRDLRFKPNEFTIVSILSVCSQLGILRHGKQVHGHVFRSRIQCNSFIATALVDLYSNCGRLDIALKVFRHSEKSESAWNSTIAAYGYHGKGEQAIELFHEMCKSGTRVTKSTFVSLLSACSHSGLVNQGLWFYNRMLEEYSVEPEIEHQVYVVDMLGKSGRLDEAYEYTKGLESKATSGVWGTLLSACNYHGAIKLGKQVAQHLFEVDPQNVGYYISLSNMYVAAGSWKDATELREYVQDQGLKKAAGYSLIDVGLGQESA
ncbi:pentatricopeptide repeat-containing protein At4g19220, mitochondrial-like [Arachis hypogaea]|nr:pentatricopeptide repeat-containing protein At4g19220, mitochondrial-like [Arachis hypogaea]